MAATRPITARSGWLQDCNAMLISALCNLSALVALGLITTVVDDQWGGVKLAVDVGQGDSHLVDDLPLEEAFELEVAADPATAMGPTRLFDDAVMPTADIAALDALSENAATQSGFEGLALGGTGQSDGASGQAATEFFGIGGYGQTFVYVVDASDSMNERGKFDRARYELLQSIEQLNSDQRYFVIFYNNAAYPMDADEPVPATDDEVARTVRWVNGAEADGGTYPLPALLFALSLRPDAIYFLSDGQFDPLTIHELRMRNRPTKRVNMRQIPIHTISFVDRGTVGLMRTISRNSGGEHRFVK
jgi:hypothetical protein